MSFREKWLAAVDRKNSVLCAGLDPAAYALGRGAKGLPIGADKITWAFAYIEAVAPHAAALKPNLRYWLNPGNAEDGKKGDMEALQDIVSLAHSLDMVTILDCKEPDIGSTTDAGLYHHVANAFDAVTIAPYAGNMEEMATQAKNHDIGAITMCLMSNPGYVNEKNALMPIPSTEGYNLDDCIDVPEIGWHVPRYLKLAHDAQAFGLDGIVIGAPSGTNHITDEEIERAKEYVDDDMLVLLPGVGAQGGEAKIIWDHFGTTNVIVNIARSLMFPKGGVTHAKTAEHYKEMLNRTRAAA